MRSLLVAACLLLAGCVYRIDVQQGNYLTQDAVDKLKVGMTKAEVRQALGTPLLVDVFHSNRWDYYFSNVKAGKASDRKRFSVFFQDDKVVSFGGSNQPPAPPPVGQAAPPSIAR
jgi:outer membrane protein assembly factor BamE